MPFISNTPHTGVTRPNSVMSYPCFDCGKVYRGRHEGAHYMIPRPTDVQAIDDEGIAYTTAEAEERGLPINTSHGWCEECAKRNERIMTGENEGRKARRRAAQGVEEGRRRFQETTERAKHSFDETIERGKHSFDETINRDAPDVEAEQQQD